MDDTQETTPFRRMLSDFCLKRLATVLPPQETARLQAYMLELLDRCEWPPMNGRAVDLGAVAASCSISATELMGAGNIVRHGFDALQRELRRRGTVSGAKQAADDRQPKKRMKSKSENDTRSTFRTSMTFDTMPIALQRRRRKRAPAPLKPIVEFPPARFIEWTDPQTFHEALSLHITRHGDTAQGLRNAIVRCGETLEKSTVAAWRRGAKVPRTIESMEYLNRIERRYRLPEGYFKEKLPHPSRSATGYDIPEMEQEEILEWVRRVVVSGATDYRKFQAIAMKQRYAIRFPDLLDRLAAGTATAVDADADSQI
eukprot:gene25115-27140_t